MKNVDNKKNPLLVFYLLVAYVAIQFCWWGYHIIDLNGQLLISSDNNKLWMVLGEGSVFLILLVLGVVKVRSSFKKELALNQQQQNFLLSVTHELKSPIATIKLYLETLLKRTLSSEMINDVTQKSLVETERLSGLVDNMLLAAKVDSQALQINTQRVDLNKWLQDTYEERKLLWENTHVIELAIPDTPITADIDKGILTIILLNLVENAIKYTPKKGNIAISLENQNNAFLLKVKDEGKGIPKEERDKIFDKFYRLGNEETRNAKGTGLGLFIVKFLCTQLGGEISVDDNLPNGSCFELKIPFNS